MSLAAGTGLGHHEILETLGSGGMGEVYRALGGRLSSGEQQCLSVREIADPRAFGQAAGLPSSGFA